MPETKKEKITPKKAYTRDTRRLHMGQYYSEGGNVYKNSTIEDNLSDIGDFTEINDKFSKAQNKLENLGVRLSSIGEAPHYVALDDNKNSYLRACFDIFDVSDDDIERYFRVESSNLFDILHKYNIPFDKFKDVMSNIINGKIDLKKFYKEKNEEKDRIRFKKKIAEFNKEQDAEDIDSSFFDLDAKDKVVIDKAIQNKLSQKD